MKVVLLLLALLGLSSAASLHREERNLHDDLQDFLAIIPVDKIKAIALDYLANDEDVGKAVAYLKSADFKSIVDAVDNEPQTKELLNYLEEHGLAAYNFLNRIHDLLGLPHIKHSNSRRIRSIRNLVDDIKAILPVDKIKALYHEKLETSKDFKNLIDTLSSQKFHDFIRKIRTLPKVQELVQKLRDHEIDVDAVVDFFKNLFSWNQHFKRINISLKEVFHDLNVSLPWSAWKRTFERYYKEDFDVQQLVVFLKSDEFEIIVGVVDGYEPEFRKLLDFLVSKGVDAYGFLNKIHDKLDIARIEPIVNSTNSSNISLQPRRRPSLAVFYYEMESYVSFKLLREVWKRDLQQSSDFRELIAFIGSDEFQVFVNRIWARTDLGKFIATLKDMQVPIDCIVGAINKLLGWTLS